MVTKFPRCDPAPKSPGSIPPTLVEHPPQRLHCPSRWDPTPFPSTSSSSVPHELGGPLGPGLTTCHWRQSFTWPKQVWLRRLVMGPQTQAQGSFRKGRGTRDQIANIRWIIEKAREFQKNIYFCFIDYAKDLAVWITINCGKFLKRWEDQTTWSASWEICMQVRKQQLELDMKQQTGSK